MEYDVLKRHRPKPLNLGEPIKINSISFWQFRCLPKKQNIDLNQVLQHWQQNTTKKTPLLYLFISGNTSIFSRSNIETMYQPDDGCDSFLDIPWNNWRILSKTIIVRESTWQLIVSDRNKSYQIIMAFIIGSVLIPF